MLCSSAPRREEAVRIEARQLSYVAERTMGAYQRAEKELVGRAGQQNRWAGGRRPAAIH